MGDRKMGVSPKSPTKKIGFSIINHPFWGTTIFRKPPNVTTYWTARWLVHRWMPDRRSIGWMPGCLDASTWDDCCHAWAWATSIGSAKNPLFTCLPNDCLWVFQIGTTVQGWSFHFLKMYRATCLPPSWLVLLGAYKARVGSLSKSRTLKFS